MNDGVLQDNTYMTLATVCSDGSPWSVPVKYAAYENALYWRSSEATVHSMNIARDARVSINVYDAVLRNGHDEKQAFYVQSYATKLDSEASAKIIEAVGHRFSSRDDSSPVYCAPIGKIDETKTTDNRFYSVYKSQNGVPA